MTPSYESGHMAVTDFPTLFHPSLSGKRAEK
jgi:hypothetical protein